METISRMKKVMNMEEVLQRIETDFPTLSGNGINALAMFLSEFEGPCVLRETLLQNDDGSKESVVLIQDKNGFTIIDYAKDIKSFINLKENEVIVVKDATNSYHNFISLGDALHFLYKSFGKKRGWKFISPTHVYVPLTDEYRMLEVMTKEEFKNLTMVPSTYKSKFLKTIDSSEFSSNSVIRDRVANMIDLGTRVVLSPDDVSIIADNWGSTISLSDITDVIPKLLNQDKVMISESWYDEYDTFIEGSNKIIEFPSLSDALMFLNGVAASFPTAMKFQDMFSVGYSIYTSWPVYNCSVEIVLPDEEELSPDEEYRNMLRNHLTAELTNRGLLIDNFREEFDIINDPDNDCRLVAYEGGHWTIENIDTDEVIIDNQSLDTYVKELKEERDEEAKKNQ